MAYEGIIAAIVGLGIYGSIKNAKFDFKESFDEYISSAFSLSILVFIAFFVVVNRIFNF